jgi:cytochrome c peroxidase
MNNADKATVVKKIRAANYANLFDDVYGPNSLDNIETAYDYVVDAIANYEETAELNPFDSKYDAYLAGTEQLTEQELLGLKLFEDEKKGRCAACHPSKPDKQGNPPMLTDFTYDNLGVPKNPDNPFYKMPKAFNPEGENWIDFGLGAILKKSSENGRFKVPTLRNIALTAPYAHNGYFKTLKEIVHFYNTRDTEKWPPPEVAATVNKKELGHLGLTDEEEDAIIAFLKTLTDNHKSLKK